MKNVNGSHPATRPNVILTGFMGTGKTTVGRLLAECLRFEFVDTDILIENRCGMRVADLFDAKGEAAFRRMEAAVARQLGEKEGLVVATGGRMMLDPENAAALGARGRVFCLTASPGEILARVSREPQARPLLTGSEPGIRIKALLAQRKSGYRQFTQVSTTGKSPREVADEILALYSGAPG